MERISDPFEKRIEGVKKEKRKAFEKKMQKTEEADAELQKVIGELTEDEAELAKEVARKAKDTRPPYGE
ncbi:MAG: hypothetical protein Q8O83_01875 [bacterium]|nr:hypothetical protein [bacterium]